ncbi:MAG: response regulator transcription factor [Candidatus Obscuribacterales bacterium]|nr:response regulator transcription factor [Candidatus Obscuribacterales bacterium]
MVRLLLSETQEDLAKAMVDYLSIDGYTVTLVDNGLRAFECLNNYQYDVIVLETALPGLDGISVVRNYRSARGTTPILLVAGRQSSEELQCGLDAGADAFLVKPFQLADLSAYLRALLRRPALRSERVLISGNVAVDTEAGTVTRNDAPVHLHPMEFKLLQFLLRHPNQVFNVNALFERVWQKDIGGMDTTVRTHVRTLRQKIDSTGNSSIITTVRGLGYKVEDR